MHLEKYGEFWIMITNRLVCLAVILLIVLLLPSCSMEAPTPVQITNTPIPPSPSPTTTTSGATSEKQVLKSLDSPLDEQGVQGWAVLVAKEDYSDTGSVNLETGFLNMYQMRALLDYYGWQDDHILEIRDNFGVDEIREALDWLEAVADQEDVVLFYIQGHSSFLREDLDWQSFFADEWEDILSQYRILVVEACQAAEFTEVTSNDPNSQVTIASVAANEIGWAGLWEEGMPIVGGVFSHYFIEAFTDPTADLDDDGIVSIQESASVAGNKQRKYMHENIFNVPEFLEQYHANGIYPQENPDFPSVVVTDAIGEPVFLDLNAYQTD